MYLRPRTVGEACAALAESPAAILAGGTDFYPALGERPPPTRVIDLSGIPDLRGISLEATRIRIGARTTWSQIVAADLPPALAALKAAAREVGSVQIQNVATIGGNLCNASPAADGVPPLLLVDATVELATADSRREVPLCEFLLGNRRTARSPDEILSAILVPRAMEHGRSAFRKLGARRYLVISIVSVAALLLVDESGCVAAARVAVGSCSAAARRLLSLEAALAGLKAGPDLADAVRSDHLDPLSPIDDDRGSARYRRDAARELVRRTIVSVSGERG